MHEIKKNFFNMYKSVGINTKSYTENCVHKLNVIKKDNQSYE